MQIEASGGQALTYGGDVSKEEDVESMIKTVSNKDCIDLASCNFIFDLFYCMCNFSRQWMLGEQLTFQLTMQVFGIVLIFILFCCNVS